MKDPDFDNLLRTVDEDFPLPQSFCADVWSRIGSAETSSTQIGIPWHYHFAIMIARPWAAASGLAAVVALGLWLGELSIPDTSRTEIAYARSISPFAPSDR